MNMKELTRSLYDATIRALYVTGFTLLLIMGLTLFFSFLSGDLFSAENLLAYLPVTIIFTGNLMILRYGMVDIITYMQVSLSYGATRLHTMLGMIWMNLVQIAVLTGLLGVLYAAVPAGRLGLDGAVVCRLAGNLFLLAGGMSFVSGIVIYRFGRLAYLILVFLITALSGACFSVANTYFGSQQMLVSVSTWLHTIVGSCFGLIGFALMTLIFWFGIRRLEVRV